jgi:2-iminobutanoate/2-iminopropanoate deaminase
VAATFGPYTPVRRTGALDELYVTSGQVGVDPNTKQAVKDVAGQTKQALENLKGILATEGLSMDDVVKVTVFLADMGDFAAMNEAYETFFNAPRPARTTVAVKELPRLADAPLLIEVEAMAAKGSAR